MTTTTAEGLGVAAAAETDAIAVRQATYTNPYLAGIGLGLALLAAFVIMGRGLGASGAFSSVLAWFLNMVAPAHVQANEYLSGYLGDGTVSPLRSWLLFEVVGVFAGAMLSGLLAHRLRFGTERGPRVRVGLRLLMAFLGGMVMAFGAALARGCTSGQALTGGALLNLGSWVFMLMVFAGGYALAYFMRWQWR